MKLKLKRPNKAKLVRGRPLPTNKVAKRAAQKKKSKKANMKVSAKGNIPIVKKSNSKKTY